MKNIDESTWNLGFVFNNSDGFCLCDFYNDGESNRINCSFDLFLSIYLYIYMIMHKRWTSIIL